MLRLKAGMAWRGAASKHLRREFGNPEGWEHILEIYPPPEFHPEIEKNVAMVGHFSDSSRRRGPGLHSMDTVVDGRWELKIWGTALGVPIIRIMILGSP